MKGLVLNITNKCNFECKTCLREYGRTRDLPLDLLKRIIPEAKLLGLERVGITGGEPCLHPDFKNIISLLVKNGIRFRFLSNGSLTEKYKFIIEKHKKWLNNIVISLDGATKETHNSIRHIHSFEKAIKSIKFFVSHGVNTIVHTCVCKKNFNEIEGIIDLSNRLGVNTVNLISMIKTPINKTLLLDEIEKIKVIEKVESLREIYNINIYHNINIYLGSPADHSRGIGFCKKIRSLSDISINPKGELVFCCNTKRDGAVIGSLHEKPLSQLYQKALDWSDYLCKQRILMIRKGKVSPDFNSCEFCNKLLNERIK